MKLNFLFLGFIFLSSVSFANDKGNGGDAVVCRDIRGNILSAELLDFWEGKMVRGIFPKAISSRDRTKFLRTTATKLENFDEETFAGLRSEIQSLNGAITRFLQTPSQRIDNVVFTNDELTDIPDSGELTLRPGCKVEQLAIKVKKVFPQDPSYIIQADILKFLSETDIAGLILHEAIYDSFVQNFRVRDSISARYLNQIVTSNLVADFYFWDYIQFRLASKFGNHSILKEGKSFNLLTAKKMTDGSVLLAPSTSTTHSYNLVFDRNGDFSSTKTRKWGSIKVSPFYEAMSQNTGWEGMLQITVNNSDLYQWGLPLQDSQVDVQYGQWNVKFCFGPHGQGSLPIQLNVGFTSLNSVTLFRRISPVISSCFERTLNVSIDDSLTLTIK